MIGSRPPIRPAHDGQKDLLCRTEFLSRLREAAATQAKSDRSAALTVGRDLTEKPHDWAGKILPYRIRPLATQIILQSVQKTHIEN